MTVLLRNESSGLPSFSLKAPSPQGFPLNQGRRGPIEVVLTTDHARELLRRLEGLPGPFGIDTETVGVNPREEAAVGKGTIVCWSIAYDHPSVDSSGEEAIMGPRAFLWADALEVFRAWLANPSVRKVGHNIFGFDKHVFSNDGFELQGIECCTLRLAQLAAPGSEAGLKSLIGRLLPYEAVGEFKDLFRKRVCLGVEDERPVKSTCRTLEGTRIPTLIGGANSRIGVGFEALDLRRIRADHPELLHRLFDYASLDARATLDLYYKLRNATESQEWRGLGGQLWGNLWDFYKRIWHPMLEVLHDMVRAGCALDAEKCTTGARIAASEAQEILNRLRKWTGSAEFNPGSPQQLTKWLYDECGYPIPQVEGTLRAIKRTKPGKRPASEASLDWLSANGYGEKHVDDLRTWRKITKLGQFLEGLPKYAIDGRVHSIMGPETITGRPTSKKPNLLNIPKAKTDQYGLRKAFVAPPGHLLVVGDYAALEPRIMAHWTASLLRDFSLRTAIEAGDIYAWIAEQAWPGAELTTVRDYAKIIFLARAYGKQSVGLSLQLGKSLAETKELEAGFDAAVPGVVAWQRWAADYTRQHFGIRTLLGRFIPLPAIRSENRWERHAAEREAVNYTCQASAADIMYCALIKLHKHLKSLGGRLLLSVYDEIVLEVTEKYAEDAANAMKVYMENPLKSGVFTVPLVVNPVVVPSWGNAK